MVKVIAALGNPGPEYVYTRHNIAWLFLEYLSFYPDLEWKNRFDGQYTVCTIAGEKVFIIKPATYMNRSGESVSKLLRFYKIEISDLLVIHDDIELDFGIMGLKNGGGLAGHNGLRSIDARLGSRDFYRLRLGISKPVHNDITSFVLGSFSDDESAVLQSYLEKAVDILENCFSIGFDKAEKQYKKLNLLK